MSYKNSAAMTDIKRYFQTALFTAVLFGLSYWYLGVLKLPNLLNKAVADTSIVLIGLSMVMSSVSYFWNFADPLVSYRKHLGVIGFWLGLGHLFLSWGAFQRLINPETWAKGVPWATFTAMIALVIFALMTLISNMTMTKMLGRWWKPLLRFGYVAIALIWLHVYFLKASSIMKWYAEGMKALPPSSVIMLGFMTVVMIMRGMLWLSLKRKLR